MRNLGAWTLALAGMMTITTVGCAAERESDPATSESNLDASELASVLAAIDGKTFRYQAWAPGAIFAGGQCYETVELHALPGEQTRGTFRYRRLTCAHGGFYQAEGEFTLDTTFFTGTPRISFATITSGELPDSPTFKIIIDDGAAPYLTNGDGEELR